MNSTIKNYMNWDKVLPHIVIDKALDISKNQWYDVRRAISQEGNYKISECAKNFVFDCQAWRLQTETKQDAHYNRFIDFYCKKDTIENQYVTSTDKQLTLKKPPNLARKPNSRKRIKCQRTSTW